MFLDLHFQIMSTKRSWIAVYQQKLDKQVFSFFLISFPFLVTTQKPQAQIIPSILYLLNVQWSNSSSQIKTAYSPPALAVLGGPVDPAGQK